MSGRGLTFDHLVMIALEAASSSTCRSQRGVAAFTGNEEDGRELVGVGFNQLATGPCDGSDRCKATCRREAVHAEEALILSGIDLAAGGAVEVIHVKAVGGRLVPSGPPDCIECAKLLRFAGVVAVWLYHLDGWRRYPIEDFYVRSVSGAAARVGELEDRARQLLATFKADEEAGYRSKDRQFAIAMLEGGRR